MGSAPSNEEPKAGLKPLTRRWRRSHPGSLGTGHRPAAVQRPRPPPCVLCPHFSYPGREAAWPTVTEFSHPCRWLASGGAVCSSGAASVGEVSVQRTSWGCPRPRGPWWNLGLVELGQPPEVRGPRSYASFPVGGGGCRLLKGVTLGLR